MKDKRLNPWFSIWFKPKETIKMLILSEHKKNYFLLILLVDFLAVLIGTLLSILLSNGLFHFSSAASIIILIFLIFIGAAITLLLINIEAELLEWTGRWMGGQGKREDIKIALIWTFIIPFVWGLIISFLLFLMKYLQIGPKFLIAFAGINYIIGIWTFIIYLNCLGEIQKFSLWKALLNSILSFVIVVIPIMFLILMCYLGYHYGLVSNRGIRNFIKH